MKKKKKDWSLNNSRNNDNKTFIFGWNESTTFRSCQICYQSLVNIEKSNFVYV